MCAVFKLKISYNELKETFPWLKFSPQDEQRIVYPSQTSFVITSTKFTEMKWGIKLNFISKIMINTRSETVEEKFPSFFKNRCLISIESFYEWTYDGMGSKKIVEITPVSKYPLFIAAIYSEEQNAFSILTSSAPNSFIKIHSRIPLIFTPDNAIRFLKNSKIPPFIKDFKVNF